MTSSPGLRRLAALGVVGGPSPPDVDSQYGRIAFRSRKLSKNDMKHW